MSVDILNPKDVTVSVSASIPWTRLTETLTVVRRHLKKDLKCNSVCAQSVESTSSLIVSADILWTRLRDFNRGHTKKDPMM